MGIIKARYLTFAFICLFLITWLAGAVIDSFILKAGSLANMLIFDISEMQLFHRMMYMLLVCFLFTTILIYKLLKKMELSEKKLKDAIEYKDKLFESFSADLAEHMLYCNKYNKC